MASGMGKLVKKGVGSFEGKFVGHMLNGHGKLYGINGVEYQGEWKNNLYHGKGFLKSED